MRNCFDQHIGLLSPLELVARIAMEAKRLLLQIEHYDHDKLNLCYKNSAQASVNGNWDFSHPLWIEEEGVLLIFPSWRVHEDGTLNPTRCY